MAIGGGLAAWRGRREAAAGGWTTGEAAAYPGLYGGRRLREREDGGGRGRCYARVSFFLFEYANVTIITAVTLSSITKSTLDQNTPFKISYVIIRW
jgi:hypothetical protein